MNSIHTLLNHPLVELADGTVYYNSRRRSVNDEPHKIKTELFVCLVSLVVPIDPACLLLLLPQDFAHNAECAVGRHVLRVRLTRGTSHPVEWIKESPAALRTWCNGVG